jgi:hypothetical protein
LFRDEKEKKTIFNISKHVIIRRESDKIDYFISHSWEDDSKIKCEVLRLFSEDFKNKNGRYPTFWFDKVCIDQNDPSNGIAVLPINIGACKKMLVLMSDTYLKRLWCVWELFTLFTFSNKEIAMERLEFTNIFDSDDTLISFELEEAFCENPNEDLKLRSVINNIGEKRFVDIIEEVIDYYEKELSKKDNGYHISNKKDKGDHINHKKSNKNKVYISHKK